MIAGPYAISREAWNARPPKNKMPLVHAIQEGTAVHYSGAASDAKFDHRECYLTVQAIQAFHMDIRGWSDIAYSFIACGHGGLFSGRGRGTRTAANGTDYGNDRYHAVCFLGGDIPGRADVTPEGLWAMKAGILSCNQWANVKRVRPHSDFKPTGCPGDELRLWIENGMPVEDETMPTIDDFDAYLASDRGQARLRKAVDELMSQGLTGNKDGAIRGWALQLDETTKLTRLIAEKLGIPTGG